MELAILPEEKTTRKTYRHFTISSSNPTPAVEKKSFEFFYIGKNISSIDNLVKSFENGYVAENLENAKYIIKRLMDKTDSIPDIIIAEACFDVKELTEFHQFICYHKILLSIPFIIDSSNADKTELLKFKSCGFIDEIISLRAYGNKELTHKVKFLGKIKKLSFGDTLRRTIETSPQHLEGAHSYIKRSFDITISSLILLAFSPIFILIAIAIKLESRGPVFYIAKRAGRGYRIFDFYKFRTMRKDADVIRQDFSHLNQYSDSTETQGPVFFKINNDPRITKIGSFLRKTSLDEIPQFVNVLKGDMSLVGNRPLPLYEASTLTTDLWAKRFMAPAGITGLWQIKKRGKEDLSAEERISLDIDYADKYNFMYDLWIMANTPSALIQKTNA